LSAPRRPQGLAKVDPLVGADLNLGHGPRAEAPDQGGGQQQRTQQASVALNDGKEAHEENEEVHECPLLVRVAGSADGSLQLLCCCSPMFLTYCPDGSLVEVKQLAVLIDPFARSVEGRFHAGEELQDPELLAKQELRFPSGEPLPRCWLDPAYGRS